MKYIKTIKGTFLERPNRFIAYVEILNEHNQKEKVVVHVKNTGRCRELLLPGVTVILEDFRNKPEYKNRKTQFDLIAVYKIYPEQSEKLPLLINMDSQAPNKVVSEWLSRQNYDFIKPEYVYGDSRIDFYMEKNSQKYLMEVKGCTLEIDGTGYFPDAPTERGVKHLKELTGAQAKGYKCFIAFVIQMEGVKEVKPNITTHPAFGSALEEAKAAGVEVLFLTCSVKENELLITD